MTIHQEIVMNKTTWNTCVEDTTLPLVILTVNELFIFQIWLNRYVNNIFYFSNETHKPNGAVLFYNLTIYCDIIFFLLLLSYYTYCIVLSTTDNSIFRSKMRIKHFTEKTMWQLKIQEKFLV